MKPISFGVSLGAVLFLWVVVLAFAFASVRYTETQMDILYPTRSCFSDVRDYVSTHHDPSLVATYGLCVNRSNHPYRHAWIESKGQVLTWGILHGKRAEIRMDTRDFYEVMGVRNEKP